MPAPLAAFMKRLLETGEAVLDAGFAGRLARADRPGRDEVTAVLAEAFAVHALEVAGPAIAFDAPSALAAAELVGCACWCTARRDEPLDEVERCAEALVPRKPASAPAHLSVDLSLRFVVHLERRARSTEPGSRLSTLLADTLRRWPLSGALSPALEPPVDAPLGGHPGLVLLFEERLAQTHGEVHR